MYREAAFELQKTLAIADDGFLYRDIFRLAPVRNPLITRLGSNYTILETTQVVEKNGGQGRTNLQEADLERVATRTE